MTVLDLIDVSKTYGGDHPVTAIHGLSLRVSEGEMAGVVGPSGSGKSTLLHIAGTLDRPSGGRVVVAGHDTAGLSDPAISALRARQIGFVFQQFFLLGALSALDNVATGLLYRGLTQQTRIAAAAATLEQVGLGDRLHHRPAQLSGGERQRVAIARALVGRPALILADEPTGNLDSHSGAGILALLQALNRDGITILVITHNRALVDALPRRIELVDGTIRYDGPGSP